MKLFLNEKLDEISFQIDKSLHSERILILAHGAGAGMDHPFMNGLANALSQKGTHVIRFNFPYMEKGRKAPGAQTDAIFTWKLVLEKTKVLFPGLRLFISGKSYGGRMASHLLAESPEINIDGVIYFGFPLHAPGKDSKGRASHLAFIKKPQLFIQGTKDKLANIGFIKEVVADLPSADLKVIEDADHSFNVPKRLGVSQNEMLTKLSSISSEWMDQIAFRS